MGSQGCDSDPERNQISMEMGRKRGIVCATLAAGLSSPIIEHNPWFLDENNFDLKIWNQVRKNVK